MNLQGIIEKEDHYVVVTMEKAEPPLGEFDVYGMYHEYRPAIPVAPLVHETMIGEPSSREHALKRAKMMGGFVARLVFDVADQS